MADYKKRYRQCIEARICTSCHKEPAVSGITLCVSCQEKCKVRSKHYRIDNAEKHNLTIQRWKKENPKKATEYIRDWRRRERLKVLDYLGGKCAWCGFEDFRALHIDHVFNDGAKERKLATQPKYYKKILADIEGRYQLLCANCNNIKKWEVYYNR